MPTLLGFSITLAIVSDNFMTRPGYSKILLKSLYQFISVVKHMGGCKEEAITDGSCGLELGQRKVTSQFSLEIPNIILQEAQIIYGGICLITL